MRPPHHLMVQPGYPGHPMQPQPEPCMPAWAKWSLIILGIAAVGTLIVWGVIGLLSDSSTGYYKTMKENAEKFRKILPSKSWPTKNAEKFRKILPSKSWP